MTTETSNPPCPDAAVGWTAVRWLARAWGSAAFLLWGAFLVEHLRDFTRPTQGPPGWVVALMGLHLAMLAGLAAGWRWEVAGACLVLVAAPVFFASAAGSRAPAFTALTAAPAVLWLACAWGAPRRARGAGAGGTGIASPVEPGRP